MQEDSGQISYSKEVYRKLLHFSSAIIPGVYLYASKETMLAFLLPFTALFIAADFLRHYKNPFSDFINRSFAGILRKSEISGKKLSGGSFTLLSGCFAIIFFERDVAVVALLVAAIADPVAALVGRKVGRIKLVEGKTVEGSLAFIITGMLIISGMANLLEKDVLFIIVGLVGVCLAAVFEAASKIIHIDDNFSVPVLIGFFMEALLR